MTEQVDVFVAGGGPVGMSCALGFALQGKRVMLGEARPQLPSGNHRLYALNHPACQVLRDLDVWPGAQAARAVRRMQVISPSGNCLAISAHEAGMASLCHMVEEDALLARLANTKDEHLQIRLACQVKEIVRVAGSVIVQAGDQQVKAALVVGADGAASSVASLAGLASKPVSLPQVVVAARLTLPKLDDAMQWMGPDGVLALLPGPQMRACLIWSLSSEQGNTIMRMPDDAFVAELKKRCGAAIDGICDVGARKSFTPQENMRHLCSERVALVGDSAHCFHPLAGQGLAVGLGDVCCLLQVLKGKEDLGDKRSLQRYRRLRYLRGYATSSLTGMLAQASLSPRLGANLFDCGLNMPLGYILTLLANSR